MITQAQVDALREPFELAGIVLALVALIGGIGSVSACLVGLKWEIQAVKNEVIGIRDRMQRMERRLAPPA